MLHNKSFFYNYVWLQENNEKRKKNTRGNKFLMFDFTIKKKKI